MLKISHNSQKNICWSFFIKNFIVKRDLHYVKLNPLNANPTKWSNTLKQFVGKLPTNCFSVFDHFVGLAFKGLRLFRKYGWYVCLTYNSETFKSKGNIPFFISNTFISNARLNLQKVKDMVSNILRLDFWHLKIISFFIHVIDQE